MGLSVGVVSIEYLDEPGGPVDAFLKTLLLNPDYGLGEDDDGAWGGGWAGNSFHEFERATLTGQADAWCDNTNLDAASRAAVLAWLAALPWQGDMIMLHLGE